MPTLTHLDVRLLEFEQANPRRTGLKADLILHRLGMSPARYYQRLQHLARVPAVQERYPRVADRINRMEARQRETQRQLRRWTG